MAADYFIAKVFKQHSSMVIVIPGVVCIALGVKAGQHVVFTWSMKNGEFQFSKFKPEGAKDDRVGASTNRADQGG